MSKARLIQIENRGNFVKFAARNSSSAPRCTARADMDGPVWRGLDGDGSQRRCSRAPDHTGPHVLWFFPFDVRTSPTHYWVDEK